MPIHALAQTADYTSLPQVPYFTPQVELGLLRGSDPLERTLKNHVLQQAIHTTIASLLPNVPFDTVRFDTPDYNHSGGEGVLYKVDLTQGEKTVRQLLLKVFRQNDSSCVDVVQSARFQEQIQSGSVVAARENAILQERHFAPSIGDLCLDLKHRKSELLLMLHYIRSCILAALALQKNGIFHGDFKPSNLLYNGLDTPVIIDCSFAELFVNCPLLNSTVANRTIGGTLDFYTPDQANGLVNEQTEVFTLAQIITYIVTGESLSTQLSNSVIAASEFLRKQVSDGTLKPAATHLIMIKHAKTKQFQAVISNSISRFSKSLADLTCECARVEPCKRLPLLEALHWVDDMQRAM